MNAPPTFLDLFSNPILRRYWRSRARPGRIAITIVITLILAAFITAISYLPLRNRGNFSEAEAARAAFIPLLFLQANILLLFGTGAVGAGILKEMDEGMVEYQRLTPLSPLTKVLGYLFGLPARQYVAFAVTAIFSAFSIVVGQIPFKAWGSVYLALFSSTLLYHLLALVTGQLIKSRWRAGLTSIGLVLLLNLVVPRLAGFGFALFSHLTAVPVVQKHIADLVPKWRPQGVPERLLNFPDVPFFGLEMSHLQFVLVVQATLIVTFIVMLVRRWRDEESHLLGKGYAVCFLAWLQTLLVGNLLPVLERGRVFTELLESRLELSRNFRRMSGFAEAQLITVLYGVLGILVLIPIISCISPKESIQMLELRRAKKFERRWIPPFADGSSSAVFVWLAAGIFGAAWAFVAQRIFTSPAYGAPGFPAAGWAVFIGITTVVAAIFHFLMEAYGRRAAWFLLFIVGCVPLLSGLIMFATSSRWIDTASYIIAISPLSAAWQPVQWLQHMRIANDATAAQNAEVDFGPFILFCGIHLVLCVILFIGWRKQRRLRAKRA
jgi:ABC-type transport system involved in multi-copper enzyme maturation permease subunit